MKKYKCLWIKKDLSFFPKNYDREEWQVYSNPQSLDDLINNIFPSGQYNFEDAYLVVRDERERSK